ncbi:MAG: family 65 glycosyl hydrolase [Blautia sp.]|nr:family 65 glycosyl hydrolase [Lachnoclostridium sp.]MCM1210748.1 family 65 glycosyl hydrolase [Blautia sp.]
MAKAADKYFGVDEWKIIEEGFNPQYGQVAESVFSLGNEHMGVRGFFEEGYSGESLMGSYFNGVYSSAKLGKDGYKGNVNETEFMVNAVNWLSVRLWVDGEKLDIKTADISNFRRILDMRNGLLSRSFVWTTTSGKMTELLFERFLSMQEIHIGVQRISLIPLNYDGVIEVAMEADFGITHQMYGNQNHWHVLGMHADPMFFEIEAEVIDSRKYLYSGSRFVCDGAYTVEDYREDKKIGKKFHICGKKGLTIAISRVVWNDQDRKAKEKREMTKQKTFDGLLQENAAWWNGIWKYSDIVIEGDLENQQGIRYCIFQMMQTYHGAQPGNNIGAKGLSGEAYNGNAFWDTETYCLPFYLFNQADAAKNLLLFRYRTLREAKERAKELDCKGAFYPIATISGKECCNLWQHASLQLQASTAVAYGIWFYEKMTSDAFFLKEYGAEMLVEICRMLVSRGDWSADGKTYGYYCVMGPDEFQMMVNHNCYTNLMGKFTLTYTRKVLADIAKEDKAAYKELADRLAITDTELKDWEDKAEAMLILQDEKTHIFEQHDGFFKLPHVDVTQIPVEEFPLYHHWSYDRIYRNDMIKQPDVLMFMLLFNSAFSEEELKANYEYYEPKCIHESSLSPSVHSILAAQIKKKQEAYSFFGFATRMDLDNYNRNTLEGLHTTSIAAAWMNIVYGFGGMRSDGECLTLQPMIPENWASYTFHVTYRNVVIEIRVEKMRVVLKLKQGEWVRIRLYGKECELTQQEYIAEIPTEWK